MALIKMCLEPKISKCSMFWIFPGFSYILDWISDVILSKKGWIIYVKATKKWAMSATQWKVIVFKP